MLKDVEPLLKECEETLAELMRMGNMEVACYVQGFINSINKLPEAEQRPHGEWITTSNIWADDVLNAWGHYKKCSCCNNQEQLKTPFCPNCGADMRKKEGEEK